MINYTPTPDYYNDYIAHFGILGMKWGKRNGPPYPLGNNISTGRRLKNTGSVKKKKTSSKVTTYKDPDGNSWKISGTPNKETQKRMKEYEGATNPPGVKTVNQGPKYATPSSRTAPNPNIEKQQKKNVDNIRRIRINAGSYFPGDSKWRKVAKQSGISIAEINKLNKYADIVMYSNDSEKRKEAQQKLDELDDKIMDRELGKYKNKTLYSNPYSTTYSDELRMALKRTYNCYEYREYAVKNKKSQKRINKERNEQARKYMKEEFEKQDKKGK